MRKFLLASGLLLAFAHLASAQYKCGTDMMYNKAKARNPFLEEARHDYNRLIDEKMLEIRHNRDSDTADAILVIPVVFHVIHQNGPENIPNSQIWDAIEVLNLDYNKMNEDTIQVVEGFDTIIANVRLEFRLATKDFEGHCTNGIERIHSIETYVGDNGSKLSQWPRERYLNVWTTSAIGLDGAAGYSQHPSDVIDEFGAKADGVILLHDYIGRTGPEGSGWTGNDGRSRALTHEVGHWLDLAHTWGGTNDPTIACDDDGVPDTPVTKGHDDCATLYDFTCNSQGINNSTAAVNLVSSYTFSNVTPSSGTEDTTPAPSGVYQADTVTRLLFEPFSAHGVSSNSSTNGSFGFTNWGTGAPDSATTFAELTGAIDLTNYYEFTVDTRPGSLMSLTGITFRVSRNETGPRTFAVRSSLNQYNSNLSVTTVASEPLYTTLPIGSGSPNGYFINYDTTAVLNGARVTMSGTGYQNLHEPVTFRIYAWNAEDAAGSFIIDDVAVIGTFGINENIQNYMEYSYCSHMFTEGQKERMRTALSLGVSGRNNLWTDQNRFLTGTDENPEPCFPQADFYPVTRFVCMNTPVTMWDNSTRATPTSWLWTFQDGNPSTSTEQYPEVSFTSFGRKTITLTVGNDWGTSSKTILESVVVAPEGTEFPGGLMQEGFDSADEFFNHWVPQNFDDNMSFWRHTNTAGYSNSTSAMLNAYDMDVTQIDEGGQDIDELVSPVMDLSNLTGNNATVTFRWAYATQSVDLGGITDVLEVYISKDCGMTWSATPRISLDGVDLVTAGSVSIPYVPAGESDWEQESFTIPNSYFEPGVRFKFVMHCGDFPNNLYIDNINLDGAVSVDEHTEDFYGAYLFPNPSGDKTTLTYTNKSSSPMDIVLTDMSGRTVQRWNSMNNTPGKQNIEINTADLAKGVYMVSLKSKNNSSTVRLMVR